MTLARILTPHRDAQGRWHVPAEIDLPYDASIHLIVSAPEHAIQAALQMAAGRVSDAITGGGEPARRPHFGGPEFGRVSGHEVPEFGYAAGRQWARYRDRDGDYVGYDEVAGWFSNLGRKIGKALSSGIGKKIVKGVVSYIPYVGPAIAQSGLVDMALDAGGKAARKGDRKARSKRAKRRHRGRGRGRPGRRLPTTRRTARRRPKRPTRSLSRAERRAAAIERIKRNGGLHFRSLRKKHNRKRAAAARKAKVQQFRDLLEIEHGATGAKHVLRLAKAVQLLERAGRGDRKAMSMIDRTTHKAAAGDRRAQMAAGYIGALVRSSADPLASILRDLGTRRAGYRPALPSHGV